MPSIAKLDFIQVCRLSLNVYNNTLRKFTNSALFQKDTINVETVQNLPLIPKTTPDGENPIPFQRVY